MKKILERLSRLRHHWLLDFKMGWPALAKDLAGTGPVLALRRRYMPEVPVEELLDARQKGWADGQRHYDPIVDKLKAELEATKRERDKWHAWAENAFVHLVAPSKDTPNFALRLRGELYPR